MMAGVVRDAVNLLMLLFRQTAISRGCLKLLGVFDIQIDSLLA